MTTNKEIKEKINIHLGEQKKHWKHLNYGLYQSFKKIGIEGKRDTEKRIEDYELSKYINKDSVVLDIGCNCGFILLQLADGLKEAIGVEINPHLVRIANNVKEHLRIENCKFYNLSFDKFQTDKKFDYIFSFAADNVADGLCKLSFEEYLDKIESLLKPRGRIFWETQASDYAEGTLDKKYKVLTERFKLMKEKKIESTYPYKARKRLFLILEARQ